MGQKVLRGTKKVGREINARSSLKKWDSEMTLSEGGMEGSDITETQVGKKQTSHAHTQNKYNGMGRNKVAGGGPRTAHCIERDSKCCSRKVGWNGASQKLELEVWGWKVGWWVA